MTGNRDRKVAADIFKSDNTIDSIAAHALSEVSLKAQALKKNPDPRHIEMLFDAAVGPDPVACSRIAHDLLSAGVTPDHICEVYIPMVARKMGDDWCEDEMTFTNVTIGTARLQYLLRELGPDKQDDAHWNAKAGHARVLLLLARDNDHTLGIMVLATQLRRRGYSVKLSIGASPEEVTETMSANKFDAVFLSASMTDDLEGLRDSVAHLRKHLKKPPPVILGGYIVEQGRDALTMTGVDKVTNTLDDALLYCSLNNWAK